MSRSETKQLHLRMPRDWAEQVLSRLRGQTLLNNDTVVIKFCIGFTDKILQRYCSEEGFLRIVDPENGNIVDIPIVFM